MTKDNYYIHLQLFSLLEELHGLVFCSFEGLPGVLGNKGRLAKYRREQGNISQLGEQKLRAPKLYHAQNMSHLAEIYRLFPIRITAWFVIPICNSVGVFLRNVNSSMS